jgi:Ca2+-transporting ATPase
MKGAEIDKILAGNNNIFARTSPFHKLKILTSLKNQGQVVAMTGDGVNDALALKKSDVGVAMGIKGTEVSKEASDIILLDDNFATIRNSILEGRRIFDNIRKFVNYLLTCNLAEVIVILVATLSLPFVALYPVQILWINLITDGLVALALSIDPAKPNIMKRKPRNKNEGIIDKKLGILILTNGILMSIVLLVMFFNVISLGEEIARTMLFTGFILFEFIRLGLIKYNEDLKSIKDWFLNKFLNFYIILT